MSWITGTSAVANTHLNLVQKLVDAATGNGATGASIVNDGTTETYVVGDILTVMGGTSAFVCKLRVTAVSSGAITGIVVAEGGSYTVNPTNPVSHSGGSGAGATFNLTMASNGWTVQRRSQQAASAVVAAGGTGYAVGNVLTLGTTGAVGVTASATFTVATLSGSAVATVTLTTPGLYEKAPTNVVAVSGGAGTGCTLTVTYAPPTTQEQVLILKGTGGGSDQIFVGLRTYSATNGAATARNWSLHGFTAFNDGLTFDAQAGISPGDSTVATGEQGAFVTLHDNGASFPLDFWFSITPNRIVGAFQLTSASTNFYSSMYVGFVNRFGSPSEWPYPIYISGCTTRVRALHDSTVVSYLSSISELISSQSVTNGPAWYRRSDGTWVSICNSSITSNDETSPSRSVELDRVLFPTGKPNASTTGQGIDNDDNIVIDETSLGGQGGFVLAEITTAGNAVIALDGLPGTPNLTLHPTPNTGGALRRLYPLTVIFSEPGPPIEKDVFGELDGVFWVSAADVTTPLTSEDFVDVGTDRYRVFQSGNRALAYTYFALREK
jgi:hypothetical protein